MMGCGTMKAPCTPRLDGRRTLAKGAAVAAAFVALVLSIAGCSGGSTPSNLSRATPSSPVDADSGTPDASSTPTASTAAVGEVVLSEDAVDQACSPSGNAATTDGSSYADGDYGYNDDSDGDEGSGEIKQLLPNGLALVACGASGSGDSVGVIDEASGSMLWTHAIGDSKDDGYGGTGAANAGTVSYRLDGAGQNVYLLDVTTVAPSGLKAGYLTRTVTALDARTGQTVWTKPLEPEDREGTETSGTALETPGPSDGQVQVLIHLTGYSSFDAATGTPLWRAPELPSDATYVGYNLAIRVDARYGGVYHLVATDVSTGKQAWSLQVEANTAIAASDPLTERVGHTYWYFGSSGFDAVDLLTGKQTKHVLYPTSWQSTISTPTKTLAFVDGSLRLFTAGDWSKPLWSVAADDTNPRVLTDDAAVVAAPSGTLLLSSSDGSILSSGNDNLSGASQDEVFDGLLLNDNQVIELGQSR